MARRSQSGIGGPGKAAPDVCSLKPSDCGGAMTGEDKQRITRARRALALAAIRVAEQGPAQQPDS